MKILSINLWFDKYGHKTLAQLKSFADFGYETYAATIIDDNKYLRCEIYRVFCIKNIESFDNTSENKNKAYNIETIASENVDREAFGTAYFGAFRYLFDYASKNDFVRKPDRVYFSLAPETVTFLLTLSIGP